MQKKNTMVVRRLLKVKGVAYPQIRHGSIAKKIGKGFHIFKELCEFASPPSGGGLPVLGLLLQRIN
jgi:hypothetical protein